MHALDWIFLVVLGASLLIGAWRGLIFELFSLAGWVAAFLAAQWLALTSVSACPLQGAKGRSVMPQDLRWYS
jgi:membrane protein required for colicin V production